MTSDKDLITQLGSDLDIKLKECEFHEIKLHKTKVFSTNEDGNVTSLKLDNLQLVPLPGSLSKFQYLKALSLNAAGISEISFLQGFSHLTDLNLSSNDIEDISPLQNLSQLTGLNLSINNIKDISPLQGLSSIINLNLNFNDIGDISFLQRLEQLKKLYLRNNKITDIFFLQTLKNLTVLDLTKNRIAELPEKIVELGIEIDLISEAAEHSRIFLHGNPLEKPPIEILRKGKEAIRGYFKSLEGEKKTLNEVKVLLVGDGAVGKTSLLKRLLGEEFDQHESKTHGINIETWKVQPAKERIKVHLWDFGGQEIMHATYQFFLSKRSLYILVLDGRKEEDAEYWLKHIQSLGGNSMILVAINKIDQNTDFEINRKFLQEKYPSIRGFFRMSCKTGEGIPAFSQHLNRQLLKVEHLKTLWPANWFKVKSQLESMEENYISYEQYETFCKNENIYGYESQSTLLSFLNDLGIVVHFDDLVLKETNIINPRWLTEGVYNIINSRQLAENKGILKKSALKQIFEPQKYPERKHDYIIALMKKFELCYGIDDETVLIPDLLQVQEPHVDFGYETALKFIIHYDFLPRSVLPRFIVNMHRDIKNQLQWRTGVVLEDKDFNSTAVVKADHEAGSIYIYVNNGQKRDYFSAILAILRRINKSFEKLKTTELIPMPDAPGITVDYKHLIRLEEEGIEFYLPGESDKKYRVKDLLGTVGEIIEEDETLQMLRTIKISQMQRKKESTDQNQEKHKE